jgi:hypothetical protein
MVLALLLAVATCGPGDAAAAERALRKFHVPPDPSAASWVRFKRLVDRHGACADGVLNGFWDDTVTGMFDKQWRSALGFQPLRRDPEFRAFVAKFNGGTADAYAVRRVLSKTRRCAPSDESFCQWVSHNFGD